MADAAVRIGRVKPAYVCSTPPSKCGGRQSKYSSGIKGTGSAGTPKTHSTPQECFACMRRHLLTQGYTLIENHTFRHSDPNIPNLVLNKPSKGYRLRGGKGDRYLSRGNTGGFVYSA